MAQTGRHGVVMEYCASFIIQTRDAVKTKQQKEFYGIGSQITINVSNLSPKILKPYL